MRGYYHSGTKESQMKHNTYYCNHRAEKIPCNSALGGHYRKETFNYINKKTKVVWLTIFNNLVLVPNAKYRYDVQGEG